MAAKKTTLEELGEMLAHVVKHMATKEDIGDVKREMATKKDLEKSETKLTAFQTQTAENFRDVKAEVADIRRIVENLQTRVGNPEGYSKEIDHALARIAIEGRGCRHSPYCRKPANARGQSRRLQ